MITMTLSVYLGKIKNQDDVDFYTSIIFEKFMKFMSFTGSPPPYTINDFNIVFERINGLSFRLMCSFPDGRLIINYNGGMPTVKLQLSSIPANMKELFILDDIHNLFVMPYIGPDLDFNGIYLSYRFMFKLVDNQNEVVICYFDVGFDYSKYLDLNQIFNFNEVQDNKKSTCLYRFQMPSIFTARDLKFNYTFLKFLKALALDKQSFELAFPEYPRYEEFMFDHTVFKKICLAFSDDYQSDSLTISDKFYLFSMLNV